MKTEDMTSINIKMAKVPHVPEFIKISNKILNGKFSCAEEYIELCKQYDRLKKKEQDHE